MKLFNIKDTKRFYETVDACVGPVLVTSSDGRSEDFRNNTLLREVLETASCNGGISTIELRVSHPTDMRRLINFMAGSYFGPLAEKKTA